MENSTLQTGFSAVNSSQDRAPPSLDQSTITSYWIMSQVVAACFMVAIIWITLSMLCHGIKVKHFRCRPANNAFSGANNHSTLFVAVFVVMASSIPRLCFLQGILIAGLFETSDGLCSLFLFGFKVMYVLDMFGSYLILWLRQRFLHANPTMKVLTEPWFNKLSYICLVALIMNAAYGFVHQIYPITTKTSPKGCIEILDFITGRMMHLASVFASSISQTLLLFLFVYPLRQQVKKNRIREYRHSMRYRAESSGKKRDNAAPGEELCCVISISAADDGPTLSTNAESGLEFSTVSHGRTSIGNGESGRATKPSRRKSRDVEDSLMVVLKQATCMSIICVSSDIFVFGLILVLNKIFQHTHLGIDTFLTIFEINTFVNTMAVFFMLKDWKPTLTCLFKRRQQNSS